jgi:hypothetical protein
MAQINYRTLAEQVRARQNPDSVVLNKAFTDELASISYNDVLYYVRLAMNGVEPAYTQKSKDAGKFVEKHLIAGGIEDVVFEYQGSVMTNTHIKGHSDIDLLAISEKFYSRALLEVNGILSDYTKKQQYYPTQINQLVAEQNVPIYQGTSKDDLRKLRIDSENILTGVYSIIEKGKPKSIKITNTNLKRDVDIVIANWYDDIRSIVNYKGQYRGIQIYNKDLHNVGEPDYPFLSIKRINDRSTETGGRLKKMIRFLKNLNAKSTLTKGLNSFEFNAICYDIATIKYESLAYYDLVYVIYQQISSICSSQLISDSLMSVDGSEPIFRGKPEKLQSLKMLLVEVQSIYFDLRSTL